MTKFANNAAINVNINASLEIAQGYDRHVDYRFLKGVVCIFRDYYDCKIYTVKGDEVADMGNVSAREDTLVAIVHPNQGIFFDTHGNGHVTTTAYDYDGSVAPFGPTGLSKPINLQRDEVDTYKNNKGWLMMELPE